MAMPWSSRSTQGIPEIDSIEDCARLMAQELVILFKHSPTCPVSWMAHREVMQYRSAEPEAPLYIVSVRRRRDVARYIAEKTGIQHESPQVIVLRRGQVVASGSHDDITSDAIVKFVGKETSGQVSGFGTLNGTEPLPNPGS